MCLKKGKKATTLLKIKYLLPLMMARENENVSEVITTSFTLSSECPRELKLGISCSLLILLSNNFQESLYLFKSQMKEQRFRQAESVSFSYKNNLNILIMS